VHFRGDSIVINKDGKPIAALVDARLFARIRRLQRRFDELSERLAQGFEGVPTKKAGQIDAAVQGTRPK
jgi:prevent-host-death family protein